jgi:hypothetical protein
MKMNSLAKHPKVITNHEILRKYVECDAPQGILFVDFRRFDDEFVPKYPRDTAEGEGGEELCVDSYPGAAQHSEVDEIESGRD